jgi:hypothetical protein
VNIPKRPKRRMVRVEDPPGSGVVRGRVEVDEAAWATLLKQYSKAIEAELPRRTAIAVLLEGENYVVPLKVAQHWLELFQLASSLATRIGGLYPPELETERPVILRRRQPRR